MTHQEIIKQIIAFSIAEQFEIIEEVRQNIKKKLWAKNDKTELSVEEKLAIVESLDGSLKMENPPMNRDQEQNLIGDYLAEKYK